MIRPLAAGERALLVDARGRRYLITLAEAGQFHTHAGIVQHSDLIGSNEGSLVYSTTGKVFTAVRPTLADLVVKMPRGAQVIYPKDLAAMLMAADVFPGAHCFEAGVGSGALSLALLRAGAIVTGYEVRTDFANRAKSNVASFLGTDAKYQVFEKDAYEGIEEQSFDRMLLDLPEPWRVLDAAQASLQPGGILVAYLPSINQVARLRQDLEAYGFGLTGTFEVLHRTWHLKDRSIRPDHRMVAHTGFLTHTRLLRKR